MQTTPAVEKVVQQRPYGRALVVVEATDDGLAYRRVSVQDGADLSRGVAVSFGLCQERPRVLFGCKEGWWFFLRHHATPSSPDDPASASAPASAEPFLHLAADSSALRAEWRDYFDSLSSTSAPSGLRKAGVLWVKRKEDKGWVRHFVVATGHSLEWLAMDGKLKEIAYRDMVLVEDDLAEGAEAAGVEDKDPGPPRSASSLVDPLKGPLSRGKAAMWKDAAAARLRLFDFHRPLVVMSKKTKRKRTFLFETSEKLGAWSALLQERIDAAAAGLQRLLGSVGSSGEKYAGKATRKDRGKRSASPPAGLNTLFDSTVEETPDRTALRNSIRDDCERAKAEAGKTSFGLLWDMHNPDDIRRINESKKAGPPGYYRILSLDGGGLRAILECVILERLLEVYPDLMERVDLFAGVSGGSMVCCGLACGYSPNFIRSCFEQHGDDIVPQRVGFSDDGKRNLAGIGAKARYPNHNFRIVGTELLQNLPLRGVPNNLLIPSFLLDNGGDDAERSWEPRIYHNIPRKGDPYARRSRRPSPQAEKEKHHFGLFSWHSRESIERANNSNKKKTNKKTKKSIKTRDSATNNTAVKKAGEKQRSLSDCEEELRERPAPLPPLRRGLSSDDILSTADSAPDGGLDAHASGSEEKRGKEKEKQDKTRVGVKKLWKTWRDDRDKTTTTTTTTATAEEPRGKAKEAKKESRVRRMKRRAQRKSADHDDNDEAEEANDDVNDNDNTIGSEEAEEEASVDDDVPPPIAEDVDMKAPVWDYVMASAAAPIVFPSFKKHIDAGVMCNAPALTAAVTVMGANMEDPQRAEDICVLSLGTGMVNKFIDGLEHDWGLLEWRTTFPELLFKAKDLLSEQMCGQLLGERYHRVNPWLRKKVAMDDPSVIPRLVAIAQSADLTETLDWVARYFYTDEEVEERRAAWLLRRQTEPAAAAALWTDSSGSAGGAVGHDAKGDKHSDEPVVVGAQTEAAIVAPLADA